MNILGMISQIVTFVKILIEMKEREREGVKNLKQLGKKRYEVIIIDAAFHLCSNIFILFLLPHLLHNEKSKH